MLCSTKASLHILLLYLFTLKQGSRTYAACGGSHSPYLVQDNDFRRILVKENTLPGTTIIRIKCKDQDGDACTFGIEPIDLPPNLIELKTLSDNEAQLVLKDKLDREIKSSYALSLTVTDNVQDPSCKIKSSAFIYIEDANDEYPKFIDLINPVDVYENTPIGTTILNITATDADTSYYGAITFKLEPYDDSYQSISPTAIFGLGPTSADGQTSIKLLAALDYEDIKVYRVSLIARDGGGTLPDSETLVTKVVLIINVIDVQDTPPRFIDLPYIFSIPENSPTGTQVFATLAQDGDTGNPNKILYSIISTEKDLPPFAIDQKSGKIVIKGMLDREALENKGGAIFLKIRAEEDSLDRASVETTVTIRLEDVNDMPPAFNKYRYYGKINENSPKLTSVILYDQSAPLHQPHHLAHGTKPLEMIIKDSDLGTNSAFELSLHGIYAPYFTIDPTSAIKEISPVIRIVDPKILDREKLKNITIKILAKEIYTAQNLWSEAEIIIMVEDVNDEIPYFQYPNPNIPTYSAYVSEGANINDKIIRILAHDNDTSTEYSTVSYSKLYGRGSEHFNLNPVSGWITLRIPLDREYRDSFSLNVEVTDGGDRGINNRLEGTTNRATCSLEIYVTDINDNAPQFTQALYEALLLEGQTKFRQNLQVKATDADQADTPNSLVKYRFLVETPADKEISSYFNINELDGIVMPKPTGPLLDYEFIFPNYGSRLRFKVEAYDAGTPTMSSFCELLIQFEDANDNAPIFTKYYYSVSVPEDLNSSQTILNVSAFDGDQYSHYNSRVNYFIASQTAQKFLLDPETGELKLYPGASLNLDSNAFGNQAPNPGYFLLNISARDRGVPPLTSQNVLVNISLYDVNDEMPRFEKEIYRAYVPENSAEGTLLKISKGLKSTPNSAQHGPTRGDRNSHRESASDEDGKGYQYELVAWDPDRTSVVRYDIVGYPEALDENRDPLPEPQANSNAKDDQILDYRTLFEIDRVTGRVYVKNNAQLDRERLEVLKIRIRATDINATFNGRIGGSFKQEDYATLIIKILDVNDNSPYWLPSDTYKKSIFETITSDERIGEEIINLEAKDRDLNRTITYAMYGKMPPMLTLNSQTGVIYQKDLIDYETTQWINFTVTATDSGIPPRISFARVFIKVLDRNDNTPRFIKIPRSPLRLYENSEIGTVVASVEAIDEDNGHFGEIHYFISDGSEGNFAINKETGVITVAGNLDREQRSLYRLLIVARDNWNNGLGTDFRENSTRVEIQIADINDNKPQFTTKSLLQNIERSNKKLSHAPEIISLMEDVRIGQEILQARATDSDEEGSDNSRISYKFSPGYGNISSVFTIDSNTGMIKVAKTLSGFYGTYFFGVEAYDHGNPALTSDKADVYIYVEDANDHAPDIIYPTADEKIFIYENQSYGHLILQMRAVDGDKGKNGEMFYRLGEGFSDKKYFNINPESGNVTLQQLPDKAERKYHFQILLEAVDFGDPPLLSNVPLNIYVVDMDNHKPVFNIDNNLYKFLPIYENSSLGPLDKIPEAVDQDINEINKIICYFIIGGNIDDTFLLEPMNRSLILIKPLDREKVSRYTLIIEASNYCAKAKEITKSHKIYLPKIDQNVAVNNWEFGNDIGRIIDRSFVTKVTNLGSATGKGTAFYKKFLKNGRDEAGLRRYFSKLRNQNGWNGSEELNLGAEKVTFYSSQTDAPQMAEGQTLYYDGSSSPTQPSNKSTKKNSPSILRVIVDVVDINDNPPVFVEKTYRTGVTTDAKIGTLLHIPLEIEDRDLRENSNHRFSLANMQAHITSPTNYQLPFEPFAVDPSTGHIKTALTFKPNLRGYINFTILVSDLGTPFSDTASVTVYLLSPPQQIMFVLSIPMLIFKVKQRQFIRTLENITGYMYNIDDMRVHVVDDVPNDEITDIVSHFIHPNGTVIDFNEIIRIFDANQKHFAELKMEYDIEKIVRYVNLDSTLTLRKALFIYQVASYAALSSLLVMLIVFLLLWLPERAKYKKKLKAATALSISGKNSHINDLNMPGTNANSYASSNPMWTGNYYNETNSKGQHMLNDQHSKLASSDVWNNLSNPSLYSRSQASMSRADAHSHADQMAKDSNGIAHNKASSKESEKKEKLLSMINQDIANIQQRILDEKSAALKSSNCKSAQAPIGPNQYNTFGKKHNSPISPPSSIYLSPSKVALYQSPRPSVMRNVAPSFYTERPLPSTPTVTNDFYEKRGVSSANEMADNGEGSDRPPLSPPRQEQANPKAPKPPVIANGNGVCLKKIDASQI